LTRYDAMIAETARIKPRRILEVGTCKGERAERLIEAAGGENIEYFGFDLFETPPDYELTPRVLPNSMQEVQDRLMGSGATINLYKGNTRETLVGIASILPIMDLIFIDGGHSAETIKSDWTNLRPLVGPDTVVYFDDYWNFGNGGCNALVDELAAQPDYRVQIIEPADEFKRPYGVLKTQLARLVLA